MLFLFSRQKAQYYKIQDIQVQDHHFATSPGTFVFLVTRRPGASPTSQAPVEMATFSVVLPCAFEGEFAEKTVWAVWDTWWAVWAL